MLRVEQSGAKHVLVNGTTVHGVESFTRGHRGEPLSYYTRQGPTRTDLPSVRRPHPERRLSIGLGSGAVAAYGRPGDHFTFYEINPAVARIASDPRYFTFVHDSKADVRIAIGDGRLELQKAPDHSYDLIVLDAFSSDSIPVHLLTREAAQLYLRKLRPGGLLAYHISSRYFALEPVVGGVVRSLGLTGLYQMHHVSPAVARLRRHRFAVGRGRSRPATLQAARPLRTLAAGTAPARSGPTSSRTSSASCAGSTEPSGSRASASRSHLHRLLVGHAHREVHVHDLPSRALLGEHRRQACRQPRAVG